MRLRRMVAPIVFAFLWVGRVATTVAQSGRHTDTVASPLLDSLRQRGPVSLDSGHEPVAWRAVLGDALVYLAAAR